MNTVPKYPQAPNPWDPNQSAPAGRSGVACPKTAHFIHGAYDGDGRAHVDWLAPYFRDFGWHTNIGFDYPWEGLIAAALFNRAIAKLLVPAIKPGDIGVGHSNGCAILRDAAALGAPFAELVFLNPALDRDAGLAPQVRRVHVLHSPSEIPTLIARYLPFHPWGDMGRVGYKGKDPRFVNVDLEAPPEHRAAGHTYFKHHPDQQVWWGPQIAAMPDSPLFKSHIPEGLQSDMVTR